MKKLVLFLIFFFQTGCQDLSVVSQMVDKTLFQSFGAVFFQKVESYSMDEIHIDSVTMFGKSVFLEGNVLEVGDHMTYFVLTEGASKMLVVAVNISVSKDDIEQIQGKRVKVWGEIGNGKKGSPIVMAKALKIMENNG